MHVHWYVTVRQAGPNAYRQCRCGARHIRHRDRHIPMSYRWLETGRFVEMPTRGTSGGAGQAKG